MNEQARWEFINGLDESLLKGGVILSEWCAFIVREADQAFVNGADLASILTATAGIETYLRSEYSQTQKERFYELIDLAQSGPVNTTLVGGDGSQFFTCRGVRNDGYRASASDD